MGRYDDARAHLEESLSTAQTLEKFATWPLKSVTLLGVVCFAQGDGELPPNSSMRLFDWSERKKTSPGSAATLNAQAELYRATGVLTSARPLYEKR